MTTEFSDPAVEAVFSGFSEPCKTRLLELREIILATAESLELEGGVEETLKWGEPSYLPRKRQVGSTVRLGKFDDEHIGLYFNCQTMLVEGFRSTYGQDLVYSKNRAVLFKMNEPLPEKIIAACTRRALRYHLDKKIAAVG